MMAGPGAPPPPVSPWGIGRGALGRGRARRGGDGNGRGGKRSRRGGRARGGRARGRGGPAPVAESLAGQRGVEQRHQLGRDARSKERTSLLDLVAQVRAGGDLLLVVE